MMNFPRSLVIFSALSLLPALPAPCREASPTTMALGGLHARRLSFPEYTTPAEQAPVQTGLDVLEGDNFQSLRGRRVGVVCNQTAVDRQGRHIVDLMVRSGNVRIVALFGPEHGIRGRMDESVGNSSDPGTGLKVYSLYNERVPRGLRYRPTSHMLQGIDTLVFDIQDIGARYYTYIATLGYVLEEAARHGIKVVVLDRPNPLGGWLVEGPNLKPGLCSLAGYHNMPITHGMTVGELALLFNAERRIGAWLEVVKMRNWNRDLRFEQTGLPWVNPSPNIRNMREATLYPGIGFLEDLPLSVGRGTQWPFEVVGAPWIDGHRLAAKLNARHLPGVSFVPLRFRPLSDTDEGRSCGGVRVLLQDPGACFPTEIGIHIVHALTRLYPQRMDHRTLCRLEVMVGNETIPAALAQGASPQSIIASWQRDVATWRSRREPYLLYR